MEKRKYPWNHAKRGKEEKGVSCVYAGPPAKEDPPCAGVYAGPDAMNPVRSDVIPSPSPELFMTVYAGPVPSTPAGDWAPPPIQQLTIKPDAIGGPYCVGCGNPIPANALFCPECGAVQPKPKPEESHA